MALAPLLGDFDSQGEARQAVLEAVLAADDHLVVFRNGHDIHTNIKIPRPTVVEELIDAITPHQTEELRDRVEIRHPRQPFDERYFTEGGLVPGKVVGFDEDAFRGAQARRSRGPQIEAGDPASSHEANGGIVELVEMRSVLHNASRHHTGRVLQLKLPRTSEPMSAMMPIEPDALQRWTLGDSMIQTALGRSDRSVEDSIARVATHQLHKGAVPPAGLGDLHIKRVGAVAEEVVVAATDLGLTRGPATDISVDIRLTDGSRVIGVVQSRLKPPGGGPAIVTFSSWKARDLAITWLDLMCLVASQPEVPWRAITVNPTDKNTPKGAEVWEITPRATTEESRRAAAIVAIEAVFECLRGSLADPIPLFPEISRGFYVETHPQSDLAGPKAPNRKFNITKAWHDSYNKRGERTDPSINLLWGEFEIDELRTLADGRPQFWADLLWGAIDESVTISSPGAGSK